MYLVYNVFYWLLYVCLEDWDLYDGVYDDGWVLICENWLKKMQELGVIGLEVELIEFYFIVLDWDIFFRVV